MIKKYDFYMLFGVFLLLGVLISNFFIIMSGEFDLMDLVSMLFFGSLCFFVWRLCVLFIADEYNVQYSFKKSKRNKK